VYVSSDGLVGSTLPSSSAALYAAMQSLRMRLPSERSSVASSPARKAATASRFSATNPPVTTVAAAMGIRPLVAVCFSAQPSSPATSSEKKTLDDSSSVWTCPEYSGPSSSIRRLTPEPT
jgi:hypothetical protein